MKFYKTMAVAILLYVSETWAFNITKKTREENTVLRDEIPQTS